MQAVFRFRGAEEIVVSNQPGGVMLEMYEGFVHQCPNCESQGKAASCANCPPGDTLKQKAIKVFSKSEARSVASAIMGAAAEL